MLSYNAEEPMPQQEADWTCSACSLAWLNRALSIDHATDEWTAVEYIGNPEHINSTWGLMDGSGARLAQCLREQGAPAFTGWLDFDSVYQLASGLPFLIGGANWYHWVGVRYSHSGVLWIANSAVGWMGVTDQVDRIAWDELGPFATVGVPLLRNFPPSPPA